MWFLVLTSISLLINSSFADVQSDVDALLGTLEEFNQGSHLGACSQPQRKRKPFKNFNEFIEFSCKYGSELTPEAFLAEFSARGGDSILKSSAHPIDAKRFQENLSFFLKQNQNISDHFQKSKESLWKYEAPKTFNEIGCQYQIKDRSTQAIHEIHFDQTQFFGIRHFDKMNPTELASAQSAFDQQVFSADQEGVIPDAVIIEGREFGQPLDCQGVLRDAFTPANQIKSESTYSIQKAFFNQMAIIPGDNQFPDDSDLELFFKGDRKAWKKAREDFIFMDIFHRYHDELKKVDANGDGKADSEKAANQALKAAIEVSCKIRNYFPKPTVNGFKKTYEQLNGRSLPMDTKTVIEDFTPTIFSKSPKGTNALKDQQDQLRNQSLLSAIQLSRTQYQNPAVIYGSGHLSVLGAQLEKNSKTVTNVSMLNNCK